MQNNPRNAIKYVSLWYFLGYFWFEDFEVNTYVGVILTCYVIYRCNLECLKWTHCNFLKKRLKLDILKFYLKKQIWKNLWPRPCNDATKTYMFIWYIQYCSWIWFCKHSVTVPGWYCCTLLPSRLNTQKAVYYKMYKIFSNSDFYIMF